VLAESRTQLGVYNDEAAARTEAAGLKAAADKCPKIEIGL